MFPTGRRFDKYLTRGHNVRKLLESVAGQYVPRRNQVVVVQGQMSPNSFIRYKIGAVCTDFESDKCQILGFRA